MSDLSFYQSRTGEVTCTAREVFIFATDIRNFKQFVPDNTIGNWQSDRESCSFNVSMLGTVKLKLIEKAEYNKVVFSGDALKKEDFSLTLHISENSQNLTEVKVTLSADLNPMLKMMAAKPLGQLLETLIDQMEKFDGWNNFIK